MATAPAKKRSSSAHRAGAAKPNSAIRRATKSAKRSGVKRAAKTAVKPGSSAAPKRMAGKATRKALKAIARKTLKSSAAALRVATERATEAGKGAAESGMSNRVPIQVGVNVAVPISVAWEEWSTTESLPDGVHTVTDIDRDGDVLTGRTAGPRGSDWEAEIVDEREQESFAWRSVEGSDCAGLLTFHELGERLTRLELDLDVVPRNPAEAVQLRLHVAHRRAEAELRRFKARVEFISPDAYENGSRSNGAGQPDDDAREE